MRKMSRKSFITLFLTLALIFSSVTYLSGVYAAESSQDKITKQLQEAINKKASDEYKVMIWLTDADLSGVKAATARTMGMNEKELDESLKETASTKKVNEFIQTRRTIASEIYIKHNHELIDKALNENEVVYVSKYSPVIIANLSVNRIYKLAEKKFVETIDISIDEVTPCTSEEDVARVTDLQSTYSYTGDGVSIGVFDIGIPDPEEVPITCYYAGAYGNYDDTHHAGYCASIIANIAIDATYYFSGGDIETYVGLEWLIDQGVEVINMSLGVGGDASSMNLYTSFSKWMDHVSYQHCITFVIAAGNYGSAGCYQASMAYNPIVVGAVNFNGTATYSDDFLSSVSSYYTGNTYASKPDICAPYGDTSSATSQVTGIIALLFEERSSLSIYPEAVKAIITASVNRSSPHRYVPTYRSTTGDNYMKFGAGLIDAYLSASNIAGNRYYTGTMLTTDTYDTYTFNVSQANSTVRVSLAIFQPVEATGDHEDDGDLSDYAIADLDLTVYTPGGSTPYASSLTSFNSVEIVQFTAPSAGTYTIRVTQYTPSTQVVFYGVAWDIAP